MPNSHISQLQCWIEKTHWEKEFWDKGWSVAGTDEAGRGPLAGPVVAAAVVLNPQRQILGVDDSKRLSVSTREHLYEEICRQAWAIGVGVVGPRTIEKINILEASRMAMIRALSYLNGVPRVVLTDAMAIGGPWDEYPLIHGDQISASIGAASIIAKVVRDRYMTVLARHHVTRIPRLRFTHSISSQILPHPSSSRKISGLLSSVGENQTAATTRQKPRLLHSSLATSQNSGCRNF